MNIKLISCLKGSCIKISNMEIYKTPLKSYSLNGQSVHVNRIGVAKQVLRKYLLREEK